jgi:hypothetical protein
VVFLSPSVVLLNRSIAPVIGLTTKPVVALKRPGMSPKILVDLIDFLGYYTRPVMANRRERERHCSP